MSIDRFDSKLSFVIKNLVKMLNLRLLSTLLQVFIRLSIIILNFRASRPLLTMYVSPEWRQSDTGMKEYHAIFLEHLTVDELRRKLALKCDLDPTDTYAIYK